VSTVSRGIALAFDNKKERKLRDSTIRKCPRFRGIRKCPLFRRGLLWQENKGLTLALV
jgi:hypothetical protein